ncbi:peptide/nickel transport system permease protein [Stella humosa]|uniref:Peptide/nickel transport system permease protein n=1 Tax=Stella humosa TaxID=94 RepID=A0A3N1KXK3_9PROT|nr:ABC transporter permease [Stella humosa]ROP83967.1 peptide/nickel transport system permease protein [Stella humosa]BBK33475.1 ABC transporter permease [Stella humosa]
MSFWQSFLRNPGAVIGLAVLVAVILLAVSAPFLFPFDPWDTRGQPLLPPGGDFQLGSDMLGRDVLAGIFHGARVSLFIGVVSTFFAVAIGVVVGAVAGYFGGIADDVAMRFTEFFQTIPSFVLAVLLVAILTPGLTSIVVAISVVTWPPVARLARSEFMALRHREFVEAAVLSGVSHIRIIFAEVLPNALTPIVIMASLMVATAILTESALSFLGLGDPNRISWGYMIGAARAVFRQAWWLSVFPGLAIFVTVLAINLVGEGLNDALNPHMRRRTGI